MCGKIPVHEKTLSMGLFLVYNQCIQHPLDVGKEM